MPIANIHLTSTKEEAYPYERDLPIRQLGDDTMKIGKKMAELRQARNLTQKELAKEARISISYLSKIESGYYPNPHIKILAMIASALGVTIEDLVGDYMD